MEAKGSHWQEVSFYRDLGVMFAGRVTGKAQLLGHKSDTSGHTSCQQKPSAKETSGKS